MFCIQKTGFQFAEIYSVLSNYIKFHIFAETYIMKRALIYLLAGTLISFVLNYFLLGSEGWALDLYYGVAFGSAWGMAYFLDDEKFTLPQKLGISFLGMAVLVVVGIFLFDLEKAVPSVIKFSMVFVAYYVFASFKSSKSLRKD